MQDKRKARKPLFYHSVRKRRIKSIAVSILTLPLFTAILYWYVEDITVAVGITLFLCIHECGHLVATYIKGVDFLFPTFIPFFTVIQTEEIKNPDTKAFISFGGPLLGGMAAILLFAYWATWAQHEIWILVLSTLGVGFNLFNLLPLRPFDGGGIAQAVGKWTRWIGLLILAVATYGIYTIYISPPFVLLFVWFVVLVKIWDTSKSCDLSKKKVKWAACYAALALLFSCILVYQCTTLLVIYAGSS